MTEKASGGVINVKTREPKYYETPELEGKVSVNYRDLQHPKSGCRFAMRIEKTQFFGVSYERYQTDGYLRNNEAEIDTVTARLGYRLPSEGYIRLTGTYSDLMREIPSANDPSRSDYDSD